MSKNIIILHSIFKVLILVMNSIMRITPSKALHMVTFERPSIIDRLTTGAVKLMVMALLLQAGCLSHHLDGNFRRVLWYVASNIPIVLCGVAQANLC